MSRIPPVLVVGLDACDRDTALALAAAGQMPVLRDLMGRSARCTVTLPPGLFVGALWPSFATGLRPDRHRHHCWDEIEVATYERRLTTPRLAEGTPFWRRLAEAGRRTVSIDVPHNVVPQNVGADGGCGVEIAEWGCHDRHWGLRSWPSEDAAIVERDFGSHPVFGMEGRIEKSFAPDDYIHRAGTHRTPEEEKCLTDGLLAGLEIKARLSEGYLRAVDGDLCVTVFGESHAVGHQQWHLHDRDHPRFSADIQRAIGGDPVHRVYSGLDAVLGRLLAAAGEGTLALVLLSHGMGPHHDGTHLLDEVLRRIDLADRTAAEGGHWGHAWRRALQSLPPAMQRAAARLALPELRRRARRRRLPACAEFVSAGERAAQRFFLEPNNYVYGGVRLNRIGREPQGRVPADAVNSVAEALACDLQALVNVATGEPVVRGFETAGRSYRRADDDALPDLFLDWQRTAPIETVWSAKTGFVHAPYLNWRTGDHRNRSLLIAAGPGIPAGGELPDMAIEDLPASLLARLGQDPSGLDGRPAAWLAG